MRSARFLGVALTAFLMVFAGPDTSAASNPWGSIGTNSANGSVSIGGHKTDENHTHRASFSNEGGTSPSSNGVSVDYYLSLVSGPDGPCIGWTTEPGQSLTTASAGAVLGLYDACPSEEAEAVPPSVLAQMEVLRFWQSKPVPAMDLEIDPGYAITGLRAYLETGPNSATSTTLTFHTPVGRAVMDVAADHVVDWGDGTGIETYTVSGGPWPDGPISHVYQWAEPVTVTVSQVWTGTWRMTSGLANGIRGQLPALPMQAELDLEIDEVQAVLH